jgi:hypothetical protein
MQRIAQPWMTPHQHIKVDQKHSSGCVRIGLVPSPMSSKSSYKAEARADGGTHAAKPAMLLCCFVCSRSMHNTTTAAIPVRVAQACTAN